jgi:ribosomal protein S20
VKEDTDLEKLVKSDEYRNFVNKTLEEQCKSELEADEHTCKYGSTEDITNEMMEKGVNDLELLRKIKNAGIQSYLVTVTKNLQTAVNEAIEEAKRLLKVLFEDADQTEDLAEAEEEATKEKVLNSNIDTTNITGDPKIDNGLKERAKKNVKVIIKKDKIES